MVEKIAPLKSSFLIIAILGFIVSISIFDQYPSWGFSFALVFTLMFIASFISMTYGPLPEEERKPQNIILKSTKRETIPKKQKTTLKKQTTNKKVTKKKVAKKTTKKKATKKKTTKKKVVKKKVTKKATKKKKK